MSPDHPSPGIPVSATAIIGRDEELAEIGELLNRDGVRLVTLTGTGGIGKTRLALAVAEAVASGFRDGVLLVSLAPLRDPALVIPTIAQALNVRERAGLSPREGVAEALRERSLLLILDNFEQVLDAATDVSWLLGDCPAVKMLVTSRQRLNIRGEHEVQLETLPLPQATGAGVAALGQNAAVRLFLARAQEMQPDLALTETTAPAIVDICRRLDGLPLAIELAAARVKVLPPAALSARLDRRLPLLTGGPRDLPDRQRTLRDTIAWSYDLLDPDEQALFRRLSVFTGRFSLHEATTVLGAAPDRGHEGGSDDPEADEGFSSELIDKLAGLIDSSLLRQEELESEPNYRMLETVREYGLEQLDRCGERVLMRDRHADFFIGLAEAAMFRLRGAERTTWLERLEQAHDNIRAALDWLYEQEDTGRAVRLCGALWQFWWWRSHLAEGRQRLEQVLALPGADAQGHPFARVLTGAGALSETQGDYTASEAYHDRAVAAWQDIGDTRGLAISLLFRWLVAFNADDQERMAAHSTESLRLFTELEDPWGTAMSLMERGVEAMRRQANDEADDVLNRSIALFEAMGDRWGVAICEGVAGNVATDRGDFKRAAEVLEKSLTALLLLNDLWGVATVMPASARLAMDQKAYDQGVRVSGAIAKLHQTLGAPLKVPFRVTFDRNLGRAREALGPEKFARLFAEGFATTPAEAVQLAITPIQSGSARTEKSPFDTLAIKLSTREREVLRVHTRGSSAREIGDELFISESTVRTHLDNLKSKLGVRNNKELIAYAFEHGLV